jgi:phage-related baseplate assembly protein
LEDYKALAKGFPGVAKAQVLDTNDCQNIRYYQVNIAVAPNGGGPPSALLKQDLLAFLESRKVITVEINLFDPIYRPVSVDAEIFAYAGEDLDVVRSRAENTLEDFFAFDRMDFGAAVHLSDLVAVLDGVRGVSHVRMYAPQQDIDIRPGEIATLGQVNLDVRSAS